MKNYLEKNFEKQQKYICPECERLDTRFKKINGFNPKEISTSVLCADCLTCRIAEYEDSKNA